RDTSYFNWPGMILTCPSCGTRYSVDGSKFPPQGRTVRCAKCGHSWHQAAEAEPEPEIVPDTAPVAPPPEAAPGPASGSAPDPVRGRAAASPPRAYAPAAAVEQPRAPLGPKLAVVAGWIGLIVVVLLIGASAVRYRQDIAVIWPQSAGVYSSL